ncbi:MAG: GMP synthase [glutamine-hydrolyzing], amidotransferase subunit / GMP synthase [glutamine-hydrolyzing], ATP pyrophosphatase subunit, partial [uncultured Nocardioidaceae bacterium]
DHRPRPRPRRRLRGAVRPAHRPPRPRGPRLLRDRPAHHAGRGPPRAPPQGDHPLRRPVVGLRSRRPAGRRHRLRLRGPGLRHVLRLPGDGAVPRGRGASYRPLGVRAYAGRGRRPRHPARGGPYRAPGLDEPRRLGGGGARGVHRAGVHRRLSGRGVRGRRPRSRRRAVAPRGSPHRARTGGPRALPAPDRRLPADLDDGQHRGGPARADPQAGRRRPGHLRVVRGRGLRGRCGARPARGRGPADVRLRRPRAAARRGGRAGRARLRGRDRGGAARRRRPAAVPRRPGGGQRPRGEAQGHRPGVHPRLRAGRARDRRGGRGAGGEGPVPRAGHALPRRRGVRRRRRDREHQVPPQRRRPSRGPPVRAGRAAADAVQGRGAARGRAARAPCGDRLAPPLPGSGPGDPDRRRGHRGPARAAPRRRCDRPRGAHPGRARPRRLAVPGGAAGRRAVRRGAGRRPHLRPPGGAAAGDLRGRDDRGLGTAALRRPRDHLHPDHQRGPRGQPRHARHHEQAARHDRVGV